MEKSGRIYCVDLLRGLDIFYLLVISGSLLMPGVLVWFVRAWRRLRVAKEVVG